MVRPSECLQFYASAGKQLSHLHFLLAVKPVSHPIIRTYKSPAYFLIKEMPLGKCYMFICICQFVRTLEDIYKIPIYIASGDTFQTDGACVQRNGNLWCSLLQL